MSKVVIYVENPDKTTNPAYYEKEDMTERQMQGLSDVIEYAMSSEKTQPTNESAEVMQQFVSGVNCHPGTAREEMLAVKRRFGKEDGTVAYHGCQSFAPGEVTPELAHQIGIELAQQLWGDKYQVVVATHLDKDSHIHSHFVLNTVSFMDGIKYHRTEKDYYEMRKASDELCRKYRLSVIGDPQPGKSKQYGEWRAEQEQRPTWRGMVRSDVDEAIREAMTERQFFDNLRKKGYEIKKSHRILPEPEPKPKVYHAKLKGGFRKTKKITGFRALYLHYCYLLGYFPKGQKPNNRRIHFLLREDLIKLDAITKEARLLAIHHIDTAQQLSSYKSELESRAEILTADRKKLYKQQRTVAVKTDAERTSQVKAQIAVLSRKLATIRQEVKLCDDIAIRSGVMKEKIQAVREDSKIHGKESSRDEQLRRRSGTGRQA